MKHGDFPGYDPTWPGFADTGILDPEAYGAAREAISTFANTDPEIIAATRDIKSLNELLGNGQLGTHFRTLIRSIDAPRIFQSIGEPGSSHVELSADDSEVRYHGGIVDQNGINVEPQIHVLLPIAEDIESIHGDAPRAIDSRFGTVRIFPTTEHGGYHSEAETVLIAGNPETYIAYARCVQLMARDTLEILPPIQ